MTGCNTTKAPVHLTGHVVDRGLVIRFANRAAERLLGVTRSALAGKRCGAILECHSCAGASLDGPRCLGRVVMRGLGQLRDAPAVVRGPDGPLNVTFSYGQVEVGKNETLLTITIRPREVAVPV